ncbi:hypothetical protein [Herbaspirillum aquaticum]|uniref:Uncharacterized protein n=1 Tax=Herbaspirillum aquaticum TaxID=568783 RepID=A0A225SQ91_9BURK|nr:hypothetical protein [Herbaspirillum aquaticum]OWY32945.1 hypothetical protein CEJ45_18645 [Herbaspirillum aquaticum]
MALLFVSGTWSVDVTKSDFPLNLVYSVRCFDALDHDGFHGTFSAWAVSLHDRERIVKVIFKRK